MRRPKDALVHDRNAAIIGSVRPPRLARATDPKPRTFTREHLEGDLVIVEERERV